MAHHFNTLVRKVRRMLKQNSTIKITNTKLQIRDKL